MTIEINGFAPSNLPVSSGDDFASRLNTAAAAPSQNMLGAMRRAPSFASTALPALPASVRLPDSLHTALSKESNLLRGVQPFLDPGNHTVLSKAWESYTKTINTLAVSEPLSAETAERLIQESGQRTSSIQNFIPEDNK
jgi:hypothetical protein